MSKVVVATTSLAGCFGCHMSFLDIDEKLFDLIELIEFHKSPFTDIKTFEKRCDIGIIEGGCANAENVETLRLFRENCDVLIALGECAISGGLPAMRNGIAIKECLTEAYLQGVTIDPADDPVIPDDEELPPMLDKVYPCHEIVTIDHYIHGCAPRASLIWEVLSALLEKRQAQVAYADFKYD